MAYKITCDLTLPLSPGSFPITPELDALHFSVLNLQLLSRMPLLFEPFGKQTAMKFISSQKPAEGSWEESVSLLWLFPKPWNVTLSLLLVTLQNTEWYNIFPASLVLDLAKRHVPHWYWTCQQTCIEQWDVNGRAKTLRNNVFFMFSSASLIFPEKNLSLAGAAPRRIWSHREQIWIQPKPGAKSSCRAAPAKA